MSVPDSEVYITSHDNLEKRAIISICDIDNQFPERIKKDVANICELLKQLKFRNEEIGISTDFTIDGLKVATETFCGKVLNKINYIDDDKDDKDKYDKKAKIIPVSNGFIIMFILTSKGQDGYKAKDGYFNHREINKCFSAKSLPDWASRPKLIFYQATRTKSPPSKKKSNAQPEGGSNSSHNTINIPTNMDIFESFASNDAEVSRGDENGSFYIQAICKVFKQHIKEKTLTKTSINNIMYEVHAEIAEQVAKGDKEAPFFISTFAKDFTFPIKVDPKVSK